MRAVALALLVFGAVAYFLPAYRPSLPFRIPIANTDSPVLAVILGALGIVLMATSGRS